MALDRSARLAEALSDLKADDTNEDAWRGLYDSLWPIVFAHVFRDLHGVTQLAEDASQEVFLRLARYGTFARIGDVTHLRRYVAAIAYNVAKDFRRAYSGWEQHSSLAEELTPSIATRPDVAYLAKDRVRELSKDLSPLDQQILALRAEGFTNGEIGRRLGISEQNAAVRLHRLRKAKVKFNTK